MIERKVGLEVTEIPLIEKESKSTSSTLITKSPLKSPKKRKRDLSIQRNSDSEDSKSDSTNPIEKEESRKENAFPFQPDSLSFLPHEKSKESETKKQRVVQSKINFFIKGKEISKKISPIKKNPTKKKNDQEKKKVQTFLDFGQKNFHKTECKHLIVFFFFFKFFFFLGKECGMKYTPGLEEDIKLHNLYHNKVMKGIPFEGWKDENILQTFNDRNFIKKKTFFFHIIFKDRK